MTNKKQQLRELLKIHFNYESFLPGQEKAIDNILQKKDSLVVLPTGGGKSLIYQLPALILEGITLVVSPLIALMKDQVDSLIKVGIPATFINSTLSSLEANERLDQIKKGVYKIVYIAPERFYNRNFVNELKQIKVSVFAIDEAHCISQWGHDFRPSYLYLRQAIKLLAQPVVIALTATATPEVQEDIIKQLSLDGANTVITGFARPNLHFAVVSANNNQKIEYIVNLLISNSELGAGIIYAGTRSKVDEILQVLLENDIKALNYHAGMDSNSRNWVQEEFMRGEAQVVVATNAFGLGINKKDIRFVIHYDLPGTIEAYYQEAGRAGRDGQDSFCILFYQQQDRYLREFFIQGDNPSPEIITEIYEFLVHRVSMEINTESSILITYAEIIQNLSKVIPEMAIGTALKILERKAYISRPNLRTSNSSIKLKKDWSEIRFSVGKRAKKQLEIIDRLEEKYAKELTNKLWEFNPEEVAITLQLKKSSLLRAIKNLAAKELIDYSPPFRGTEIKLLKIVAPEELDLDFKALKNKAARAYEKLDEMENYVHDLDCRQKYILHYFGDHHVRSCGKCDNCLRLQKNHDKGKGSYLEKEYLV